MKKKFSKENSLGLKEKYSKLIDEFFAENAEKESKPNLRISIDEEDVNSMFYYNL